ncbi:50S ribosomal protein L18 [Candidatus Nomurabacteria bacterium]|nr:50S ribosomal protein L18 [Candidatus Nomurabacteria bacterium]
MKKMTKQQQRVRRHIRVRGKVSGTATRPRLAVFRSLTSLQAQLIDDTSSKTLVGVHTKKDAGSGDAGERTGKAAQSYLLGLEMAKQAKAAGISQVIFDRGGYQYHGRVKAFAEGARDGGLEF